MLHTVKTTCAISALLVSFAATAHAANVVSDPYASYIDCSYGQIKTSGNSGCTVRGQQVTVSALSQMMAVAAATATADMNYNNLRIGNSGEYGNVQYERGTERGADGKDREVKRLVFVVDNHPKGEGGRDAAGRDINGRDAAGRPVGDGDIRDANGRLIKDGRNRPTASSSTLSSSEGMTRVYKIDLSDAAAAQIEKAMPRKKERDEGASTSSADTRVARTRDGDTADRDDRDDSRGRMEVVMPLAYASPAEIKAEEAKIVQAGPGASPTARSSATTVVREGAGTAVEANIRKDSGAPAAATSTVTLTKPVNADQGSENLKAVLLNDAGATSGVTSVTLRIYNAMTTEVIYSARLDADAAVLYYARVMARPVTATLAQGASATPGENIRDQNYSGTNNTSSGSANQPEPMDKDEPESGKGGSGTLL